MGLLVRNGGWESEVLRVGAFIINGMREKGKRGDWRKEFKDERLSVLRIRETHFLGKGLLEEGNEQENKVWQDRKGDLCCQG